MIARHDGLVVLVSAAIPGERVRALVERIGAGRRATPSTVEVVEASPDRRAGVRRLGVRRQRLRARRLPAPARAQGRGDRRRARADRPDPASTRPSPSPPRPSRATGCGRAFTCAAHARLLPRGHAPAVRPGGHRPAAARDRATWCGSWASSCGAARCAGVTRDRAGRERPRDRARAAPGTGSPDHADGAREPSRRCRPSSASARRSAAEPLRPGRADGGARPWRRTVTAGGDACVLDTLDAAGGAARARRAAAAPRAGVLPGEPLPARAARPPACSRSCPDGPGRRPLRRRRSVRGLAGRRRAGRRWSRSRATGRRPPTCARTRRRSAPALDAGGDAGGAVPGGAPGRRGRDDRRRSAADRDVEARRPRRLPRSGAPPRLRVVRRRDVRARRPPPARRRATGWSTSRRSTCSRTRRTWRRWRCSHGSDGATASSYAARLCGLHASMNPSNSGRNSPVRQKFSGCHWTPRQKVERVHSIASTTPSGAVAVTSKPGRQPLDRLVVTAVHRAACRRRAIFSCISVHSRLPLLTHTSCAMPHGGVGTVCSRHAGHLRGDVLHERAAEARRSAPAGRGRCRRPARPALARGLEQARSRTRRGPARRLATVGCRSSP